MKFMKTPAITIFCALVFLFCCLTVYALAGVGSVSEWPVSWPEAFDAYRKDAIHIEFMTSGPQEDVYAIRFQNRGDFEKLWPDVLKVQTEGAPLTLKTFQPVPDDPLVGKFYARPYLRILTPPPNPPGKIGSILLEDGKPAEYAAWKGDGWRPMASQREQVSTYSARVRTDIELYVDGRIIDLNRIRLPENLADERTGL